MAKSLYERRLGELIAPKPNVAAGVSLSTYAVCQLLPAWAR